jgi:fucose 4-O-acetylase-like acetyltransferase
LAKAAVLFGVAGVGLFYLSEWLDARPVQLYAVYDYWHSGPNFLLARVGILLVLLFGSYAWCRWGLGQVGFSPLIQLGTTSLLVYWVHIEFVYGRFSILAKHSQSIPAATAGIVAIFIAMVAVAAIRNRVKGRGIGALAFWRRPARAVA